MKKMLLSAVFAASVGIVMGQGCIELFISEYVEGWGNNKALEIYNPTSQPKQLNNYMLERYSNGSSSAATNQRYELPNETIAPYSTWVIVIDKRVEGATGQEQPVWTELQAKADHFANPVYNTNNTMYFNGNDAMVLRNISQGGLGYPIDVFGRIGEDPAGANPPVTAPFGWNNVGPAYTWINNNSTGWTKDHSLIRKFDVTIGYTPAGTPPFNVGLQWDSIPPVVMGPEGFIVGNWESLGWHDCECFPLTVRNGKSTPGRLYPNPVSNGQPLRFVANHNTERYEIYDLSGKLVGAEVVPQLTEFEIATGNLPKGVYMLRSYAQEGTFTHKFVVQ